MKHKVNTPKLRAKYLDEGTVLLGRTEIYEYIVKNKKWKKYKKIEIILEMEAIEEPIIFDFSVYQNKNVKENEIKKLLNETEEDNIIQKILKLKKEDSKEKIELGVFKDLYKYNIQTFKGHR